MEFLPALRELIKFSYEEGREADRIFLDLHQCHGAPLEQSLTHKDVFSVAYLFSFGGQTNVILEATCCKLISS